LNPAQKQELSGGGKENLDIRTQVSGCITDQDYKRKTGCCKSRRKTYLNLLDVDKG
jgi:hypothetical protein